MIEAKIHAVIMIITICCAMPEITVSEKSVRFLAKRSPTPSANSSTGQKPRSSGAPDNAMTTTPMIKMINGNNAPNTPP